MNVSASKYVSQVTQHFANITNGVVAVAVGDTQPPLSGEEQLSGLCHVLLAGAHKQQRLGIHGRLYVHHWVAAPPVPGVAGRQVGEVLAHADGLYVVREASLGDELLEQVRPQQLDQCVAVLQRVDDRAQALDHLDPVGRRGSAPAVSTGGRTRTRTRTGGRSVSLALQAGDCVAQGREVLRQCPTR